MANILAPVLAKLLDEGLGELVSPSGVLILSGIIETQVSDVEAALIRNGLTLSGKKQILDWVSLMATNDPSALQST